ncbi:MAG: HAMP domain-containing histidine kinase [Phycisphaerales bacterium]|nr:HAMP domain-containing histidine kinase [Phycisphaerales bacterium]
MSLTPSIQSGGALAEKLAALGAIAAKVAHELNSPLDGSRRFVSLALRAIESAGDERTAEYLRESLSAHDRMQRVVRELLDFVRSARPEIEEHGLDALLEEAIRAHAERAARQGVVIVSDVCDPAPQVAGDGLYQVFTNIIRNALDAMADGGTLRIRLRADAEAVEISFQDTGIGLPAESQRVFEPLFTTKPAGRGTGLGLALCREIVTRQYHGSICAEPGAEGGAVFTVRIPSSACRTALRRSAVPLDAQLGAGA